jgi:U2 small nuclear ribonucleoprotein A'
MRLTAEIIGSAEQRTNPVDEREIILRGLAIPAIENLAVTRDAFDTIDMTDNRLSRVDNIPRLHRLSNMLLAGNLIETIDNTNLAKNVPNLRYMDLSYNRISSLYEVSNLGKACPKLEILSLHGNAVQRKFNTHTHTHTNYEESSSTVAITGAIVILDLGGGRIWTFDTFDERNFVGTPDGLRDVFC